VSADFRPPVPQSVVIPGPTGGIEARVEAPARSEIPAAVGVVCHPHPLYGGTMQNKVVHTLARAMQDLGTPTVRFNFRGVGASEGVYGGGPGELDDAVSVIAWARARWDCEALWLAGFSFGAAVALQASALTAPRALVTVAPPVGRLILDSPPRPACPWLVVQGDRDELVEFAAVQAWVTGYEPRPGFAVLGEADHFFHGRLVELRGVIRDFLLGDAAAPGG
jgi:alpha/beta superfamily hydrolase